MVTQHIDSTKMWDATEIFKFEIIHSIHIYSRWRGGGGRIEEKRNHIRTFLLMPTTTFMRRSFTAMTILRTLSISLRRFIVADKNVSHSYTYDSETETKTKTKLILFVDIQTSHCGWCVVFVRGGVCYCRCCCRCCSFLFSFRLSFVCTWIIVCKYKFVKEANNKWAVCVMHT